MSQAFIDKFQVHRKPEFLGYHPLQMVGGLDAAFSTGGDQCLLQLAVVGQESSGKIVIDFRDQQLLFPIGISAVASIAAELQIAAQVNEILKKFNIPLHNIAIDSNGQGRALGSTIYLAGSHLTQAIKIYCTRGGQKAVNSFDVEIMNTFELWDTVRSFVEHGQVCGLSKIAAHQLCTRLVVIQKNGRPVLELKKDYKKRMGAIMPSMAHSPDEADATALCLQAAIKALGFSLGQRKDIQGGGSNDKFYAWKRALLMSQHDHLEGVQPEPQAGGPSSSFGSPVETVARYKPPFGGSF